MLSEINELIYPFFQIGFLLCIAFLIIWNRVLILRFVILITDLIYGNIYPKVRIFSEAIKVLIL